MQRKIELKSVGTNSMPAALAARLVYKKAAVPLSVAPHENVLFLAVEMA
jgi:hypothetical protein